MRKLFTPLLILNLLLSVSCKNDTKNQPIDTDPETETKSVANEAKNAYAVITTLTTDDPKEFNKYISEQSSQLNALWEEGTVENLYYNTEGPVIDNQTLPSIAYFILSTSKDEAGNILDKTTFIKNNVGTYELIPVGNFLFGQSETAGDIRLKKQNAYVVIWDLLLPHSEIARQDIQKQFDADFELYEKGIIENAYKNSPYQDKIKNFTVYFMNANSMEEVQEILNDMPFVKLNIGSYKIRYVGNFMRGRMN